MRMRKKGKGTAAMSKFLSCLLALTLLVPAFSMPAAAADSVLVSDDFSSYALGDLTIGSGNTWTKEGAAPAFVVKQDSVTGSTYGAITNESTGSSYIGQRFAGESGGLIVEFDVNLPTGKGGSLWVMDGKVNATNAAAARYQLDAGVIKQHNAAVDKQLAYDVTHWYRFKMVFNVPSKQYNVSVTDLATNATVNWPSAFYSNRERISSFGFYVNPNGGQINVANVRVTALDVKLAGLVLGSSDFAPVLNPPFDPGVYDYSVEVPYSAASVDVTPTASNAGLVGLKLDAGAIASGQKSTIPLTSDETEFGVSVTSSAYTDISRTYKVKVNKLEKSPNVTYVVSEAHDETVKIGWEQPQDPAFKETRVYLKNEDTSLTRVDTVPAGKYISTIAGLSNGTTYSFVVKGAYEYVGEAVSESSGIAISETPIKLAPRQMEALDRGLVAVKETDHVYVGWRLLGTDAEDIAFNLYRDGVKLNSTPITGSTNYTDVNGSSSSTYNVRAIIGGVEQTQSETVDVWDTNYLNIPLEKPEGGVTPDGVAYTYSANDASVGDLDGDGQYEIIMSWMPSNAKDNSQAGYTGNVYVDAYKLDGTRLWRMDLGKNMRAGAHYLDIMVYDLDGDGKAEVTFRTADGTIDGSGVVIGDANADHRNASGYILTGPEFHTVFEGATGKALATDAYEPERGNVADWGDAYGNRVDRFLAAIAYLDGERPSIVMQRGYYTRMVLVAYNYRDGELTKVWTFDSKTPGNEDYYGQGNHQLSVADVDNDGRDEIITGAAAIDDNGDGLWSSKLGHGDAMHLSNLNPDRLGLELFAVQEDTAVKYSYDMKDARTGRVLWGQLQLGIDAGRGLSADIDPRHKGAESWAIDGAWNSTTGGLFNAKGEKLSASIPTSNFAIWWDGDLSRELLDHNWLGDPRVGVPKIDKWDYENEALVNLETFSGTYSINDTKGNPNLQADLFGDWREEVVLRTEDSSALRIYTTTAVTEHRIHTLMHDPVYRLGIAWQNTGYNQPPHTSFYLGTDMEMPERPNIRTNAIAATSLSISAPSQEVTAGQQLQLSPVFLPAAATNKAVTWAVAGEAGSPTTLATINANGLLSAVAAGKVKVTATANDGSGVSGELVVTISAAGTVNPGAGSGSSGTGATTPPTSTPAPANVVLKPVVTVDTGGKASAEMTAAELSKGLDDAAGKKLAITAVPTGAASSVQVTLPAQALKAASGKQVSQVELNLGLASITLDTAWLSRQIEAGAGKLEISAAEADISKLSAEAKAQLGDAKVYDLTLTIDGKAITSFAGGVKVALDYSLQAGESPNKVVVYYIDDNGEMQIVKNGKYEAAAGHVTFKPEHFSKYAAAHVNIQFNDIERVAWAKDSIESLAARGIINGMGNQAFKPDQQVTRAQFLKMLLQTFDLEQADAASTFSDVQPGSWYYSSVASAQELGIVEGKANGTFGFNDEITREDMAVMAHRVIQKLELKLYAQGQPSDFKDSSAISSYAKQAVDAMQSAGIIKGTGNGSFEPKSHATRAQAAVVINALLGTNN
ncbi:S-layer homology domain-containing protein [Paenibacillus sp. FSL H8-0537]|uniref:rhamnogalacturonan lyase family protein n=1 Tax=Paenibacillus sp. FSL H8-0537 TaxID=2921399 RepID=UPI0031017D18